MQLHKKLFKEKVAKTGPAKTGAAGPIPPALKCITQVQPYSLYKELGIKIKQALVCGRKQYPVVKISFGFDYLLFKGGLQTAGTPARCVQGYQQYKIKCYSDLDSLWDPN